MAAISFIPLELTWLVWVPSSLFYIDSSWRHIPISLLRQEDDISSIKNTSQVAEVPDLLHSAKSSLHNHLHKGKNCVSKGGVRPPPSKPPDWMWNHWMWSSQIKSNLLWSNMKHSCTTYKYSYQNVTSIYRYTEKQVGQHHKEAISYI